mgnify:CR=1 FL=1
MANIWYLVAIMFGVHEDGKVDVYILVKRLQNSKTRPLIYKKNLKKELMNLINQREKYYQEADLIVKNEKKIIETTKNIIEKIIN